VQRLGVPRGNAVVWAKCDRIPYQRPGMLARNLHRELGRIFRAYLRTAIAIRVNGTTVTEIDPIRITPGPRANGDVTVLPPLVFPFAVPGGAHASVRVTFATLPVEAWAGLTNEEKRLAGITGTGTVSVMRAGREIVLGWHLMGSKRRENYDDWWRCEIAFDPAMDELFGVSHSKQGIRPVPELSEALTPTLESQARQLNRMVRERFAALNDRQKTAVAVAERTHHKLLLNSEKNLRSFGVQHREQRSVTPTYSIDIRPSADVAFLSARRRLNSVILSLNSNHPFYSRLYRPLSKGGACSMRQPLDLLLLALARALCSARQDDRECWNRLLDSWSNAAALLLEEK
jgi:hypothetical protein